MTTWIIVILGGGTFTLVAAFALLVAAVVVIMAANGGSDSMQACAPNDTTGGSGAVRANAQAKKGAEADSIPENYLKLYKKIGRERNIPWNVLAGIGRIETNHGRSKLPGVHSGENSAGAGGPMQFLQSSWNTYGSDGDGDGIKDRYNPADAILATTKHLRGRIGKSSPSIALSANDILRAVHFYNPGNYSPQSNPYAKDVLGAANGYANKYKVAPANYAGTGSCSGPTALGSGSFGQRIAYAAAYYAQREPGTPRPPSQKKEPTPYSWGGGTLAGIAMGVAHGAGTTGFDCSGLARHAVYKASKKKIQMPRTTFAMWASNKGVKVAKNKVAPGDLVFFHDFKHMAVYYGKVNGVRWMVEALKTGTNVKFSRFDERRDFEGALRVTPPAGKKDKYPDTVL